MCEKIRIDESLLQEASRQDLLNKSKNADNYSKNNQSRGKNRYERRLYSHISNSVRDYNNINMDAFFKGDILEFGVKVQGETDDYIVTITFEEVLREIQREVKGNNNVLNFKCVLRALMNTFNNRDVYVSCTCLHPDTKIKLLDGTTPTIREMCERFNNGEKLYVYSTDEKGDFKPGEVENVWQTKITKEFIKVILDNGEEILTTPNHLYMLRDGSYEMAENLNEGQSLMPMYFNSVNGYETVKFNSESRGWHTIYKLVADYFKFNEIEEVRTRVEPDDNMSYDVAIHHKDFNKKNNNPENLQIMTAREHWDYHASLCGENRPVTEKMRETSRQNAIRRNANPTNNMIKAREKWVEKGIEHNYDEDWKVVQSKIMKDVRNKYYDNMSEDEKNRYSKLVSDGVKTSWQRGCFNTQKFHDARVREGKRLLGNKSGQEHMMKCKMLKTLQRMIDDNINLTVEKYNEYRKINRSSKYEKYFDSFEQMISEFKLNHKIVKIERVILEDTPVYDIQVKDWNNFVIDAGVVLHNCKDWTYRQAYWATQGKYNSGTPQTDNGKQIANPNDSKGAGCKHVLLVLSNLDWLMKIASVINNYIRYSRDYLQRNYADYIFPVVYGVPYNKAVQLSIFDKEDKYGDAILPTDQKTIDDVIASSQVGRDEKGKFTTDNQFKFQSKQDKNTDDLIDYENDDNQMKIDFDSEENK